MLEIRLRGQPHHSSFFVMWCVHRDLHVGVCFGVYLGVLGQGRGSLMRRQSRRNMVIYTGAFAIIMFIKRSSNSFYSILRIQSVEHGVSFLFAAIVARADDDDDDDCGKDDRYIKLSALFCTLS